MVLLLASVVLARDVVVVGERYEAASPWPSVLVRCLDEARPGAFAVADASSPGTTFRDMRRALEVAPVDAVVLVAIPPPKQLGVFERVGWRRALAALLEGANTAGRTVLLFGPWPAARVLVAQTGSMPDSAIGIRDRDRGWVAAGEVAAQVGVRHVPWEGREAQAAAALVPPARSGLDVDRGPWADVPRTDAVTLGRLACGAVLGSRVED